MSLIGLVRSDLRAKAVWCYGAASGRNLLKTACTDGTFAMVVYRLMQACQKRRLYPLAMVCNKVNALVSRCIIGRGAEFGPGFVLIHSLGVVINSSVRGGRDIRIEHLVTIGAEKGVSPVLGDDVFLGAGAKIIGPVRIGSGARIGANAVVTTDIPDGATAVGIPARVVREGEGRGKREEGRVEP